MSRGKVLFYVQCLLGVGHLKRAYALARGMAGRDVEVVIASGGVPDPDLAGDGDGVRLHQLPPMRTADGRYETYLDESGAPIDDAWKARRRASLLSLFGDVDPDVLIIESFPFGRRMMRFELLPLLEAARARRPSPAILCSVRDLVQAKRKPGRVEETVELLTASFDRVLVHGDPDVIRFDESFPLAEEIESLIDYTGYVVAERAGRTEDGRGEVIVSTGGGAFGERLFAVAVAARELSRLDGAVWRLLLGPNLAPKVRAEIELLARAGVIVESARSDYRAMLETCAVSVSLGGYNSVMDVLASGARAVIVSHSGIKETEQTARAQRLAALGLVTHLPDVDLTPPRLAAAVDAALADTGTPAVAPDLNGVANTADAILEILAARRAEHP